MPLSDQHRHAVLLAGRTQDVSVITTIIAEVLVASPGTNLFEIEQAFRDNASAAYLVATTEGFVVVLGAMAMLVAVSKEGMTVEQNRAALATCRPWPAPPARICELIQVQRGKGRYALVFFRINQVAATCELVRSHLRSSRYITCPRRHTL